jgi:hypothetical protein
MADEDTGSSGEKQEFVPMVRFEEVNGKFKDERRAREDLERRLAEVESNQKRQPQDTDDEELPVFSEAQIAEAVEAQRISPDQAAEYRRALAVQEAKQAAKTVVRETVEQQTAAQQAQAWNTAIPALTDPASDESRAVQAETDVIKRDFGLDDTKARAMALRNLHKSPEQARQVRRASSEHEHMSETGGGDTGDGDGGDTGDKLDPKMPKANRAYYQEQIEKGRMTAAQVNAQWKRYTTRPRGPLGGATSAK